jgi:UTP--glucose-1-phosphate uridylyltransferase
VFKLVGEFDKRFPEGAPSLRRATSLRVEGDVTFGHGVQVVGDVTVAGGGGKRVDGGTVLTGD